MLECLQCNDPFIPEDKELFCCMECRLKFWRSKSTKGNSTDHLEDLKMMVERSRAEAKALRKSIDRVEHDYQDWEDRVIAIENRIRDTEELLEIEEKELDNMKQNITNIDVDVLDELFGS